MSQLLNKYRELISYYESGLYTDTELVSNTFTMLGEGNEKIWAESPDWVKDKIRNKFVAIKDDDEYVSFSNRTSDEIRRQLFTLQGWLRDRGELGLE
jgi:hypothetical protein